MPTLILSPQFLYNVFARNFLLNNPGITELMVLLHKSYYCLVPSFLNAQIIIMVCLRSSQLQINLEWCHAGNELTARRSRCLFTPQPFQFRKSHHCSLTSSETTPRKPSRIQTLLPEKTPLRVQTRSVPSTALKSAPPPQTILILWCNA